MYIYKFTRLVDGVVEPVEQQRFLTAAQHIDDVNQLNVRVQILDREPAVPPGIFG
jgi:2-methylcitrate dehydratase